MKQQNEHFEYESDALKWEVWCGFPHGREIGPSLSAENAITGNVYVDMLELFSFPPIEDFHAKNEYAIVFQYEGTQPRFVGLDML